MDVIALGGLIRDTRKSLNLTLQDLTQATGISISHLSKIERGVVTVQREQVISIAQALKLNEGRMLELAGYSGIQYGQLNLFDHFLMETTAKYEVGEIKLSKPILDWMEVHDRELTQRQMLDIAEEMVAYYETRKKFILERGGGKKIEPHSK